MKHCGPFISCRYIISAESGNILIWHRVTELVIFKEEQSGIKQLTLIENGEKVLAISVPTNPPGNDIVVRSTATGHVRSIPGKLIQIRLKIIYYYY